MSHWRSVFVLLLVVLSSTLICIAAAPGSDPQAVSLATRAVAALTGGTVVGDVTLEATVTSVLGSDNKTGTGLFQAKGTGESRITLNLGGSTRDEVRNAVSGSPSGGWKKSGGSAKTAANHNCWTDAVWFFPALSALVQTANPNFVFKYIGNQQHHGLNSEHIRVFQAPSGRSIVQKLSEMDFYLDPGSLLPLSVEFNLHTDADMKTNVPVTINFANYQSVNGILVPFRFQEMLNGSVILDVTVTSAIFNRDLPDSTFALGN